MIAVTAADYRRSSRGKLSAPRLLNGMGRVAAGLILPGLPPYSGRARSGGSERYMLLAMAGLAS
jgi:hypothetical protein